MTVKVTVISKTAGTAANHKRENSKYKQAFGFNQTITAVICSYNENSSIIPSIGGSTHGQMFSSSSMSLTAGLWDDEEEGTEEDGNWVKTMWKVVLENGVFLRSTPAWAVGKTDECVVDWLSCCCLVCSHGSLVLKICRQNDSGLLHNRHDNQTNLSGLRSP